MGSYATLGDWTSAAAIGFSEADGTAYSIGGSVLSDVQRRQILFCLDKTIPWYVSVLKKLFCLLPN